MCQNHGLGPKEVLSSPLVRIPPHPQPASWVPRLTPPSITRFLSPGLTAVLSPPELQQTGARRGKHVVSRAREGAWEPHGALESQTREGGRRSARWECQEEEERFPSLPCPGP